MSSRRTVKPVGPRLVVIIGLASLLGTRVMIGRGATAAREQYDFHPTWDGLRISEANADVPGGYTESSLFPRLMADHCPGTQPAGDPAT